MSEWYVSRVVRWPPRGRGGRSYVFAEGTSPYNELVFHRVKEIAEFATWHLGLEVKYQKWPPVWSPKIMPPQITGLRFIDVRPVDVVIGWLITAVAIYRAVRR